MTPRARARALLERDWDAIVIGSGLGGLVCASLLASRASMRVLVLERHYEPGGLTQTFKRRRYAWDIGVHYVGGVSRGSMVRRVLDAASGGSLLWVRLPERHDRVVGPGIDARLGGNREALRAQWSALVPGEEDTVDRLLSEIDACARSASQHLFTRMRDGELGRGPFFAWADRTTAEVLGGLGASPRLAALASYTWPDYGSPPEQSSFAAHAITTAHYFDGAYYPVGGGGRLARDIATELARHRGALVVRAEVESVVVSEGRARGVLLADGARIDAALVISDAGARATFERLVQEPALRDRAAAIGPSSAHVGLYLGLRATPRALGLDGANLWLLRDGLEHASADGGARWVEGVDQEPPSLFVSTGCAIDPSFERRFPGRTALTGAVAVPFASFARFCGTGRGRRGDDYGALKDRLARGMLDLLGRHLPLDAIDHVELSTPLSTAHFSGHAHGEVYGLDPTPLRFRTGPGPHTPIAGLYLTGQDVFVGGIAGATCGGLLTACAITRRDLARELLLG